MFVSSDLTQKKLGILHKVCVQVFSTILRQRLSGIEMKHMFDSMNGKSTLYLYKTTQQSGNGHYKDSSLTVLPRLAVDEVFF
jgi:hypothetical protein